MRLSGSALRTLPLLMSAFLLHAVAASQSIPTSFSEPFETSGTVLRGLVIVADPAGYEATIPSEHAAKQDTEALAAARTNFAVAALLRHHVTDAGGDFYLTRQDDRPATNSLEEYPAREMVVRRAQPHFVVTIAHTSSERAIVVPAVDSATSDPVSYALAQILAHYLAQAGLGAFDIRGGTVPLHESTGATALVLMLPLPPPPPAPDWRPRSTHTSKVARAIYSTCEEAWTGKLRDTLETRRTRTFRSPRAESSSEAPPPEGVTTEVASLARNLWHGERPPASVEEARRLLDAYKKQTLTDTSIFYLDTQIEQTPRGWRVVARSNFRQIAECAVGILRTVGCSPLEATVEVLPNSASLGKAPFAVAVGVPALIWGAPEEGNDVQTQVLPGEPLWLLDRTPDSTFYLVQGVDGYIGWLRSDSVALVDAERFDSLLEKRCAVLTAPWCDGSLALTPGTRLPLVDQHMHEPKAGRSPVKVQYFMHSSRGELLAKELTIPAELLSFPPQLSAGQRAVETALSLYGSPYVFGGRSANGIDCSGLVGVAYESAGLRLPRDARQQILVGRLVATRWHRDALQPGDILFFISKTGRVVHTGLSLGGNRFIHSCPPSVRVNSFSPDDHLYSKTWSEAFAFARRPLP